MIISFNQVRFRAKSFLSTFSIYLILLILVSHSIFGESAIILFRREVQNDPHNSSMVQSLNTSIEVPKSIKKLNETRLIDSPFTKDSPGGLINVPKKGSKEKIDPSTEDPDQEGEEEMSTKGKQLGNQLQNEMSFDENAVRRFFMVMGGFAAIVILYLGVKFACIKKRKPLIRRYGRLETSEMNLMENMEDEEAENSEDDDTLFDLHSHRHT